MKKNIILCMLVAFLSCKKESTINNLETVKKDTLAQQINDFSKTVFKDRAEELVYIREYLKYKLPKILVEQNPEQIKKVQYELIANGENPSLEEAAKRSLNFNNNYEIYMNLIISESTTFKSVKEQLETKGKLNFNITKDIEVKSPTKEQEQEDVEKPSLKKDDANALINLLKGTKSEPEKKSNETSSGNGTGSGSYIGADNNSNKGFNLKGRKLLSNVQPTINCNEFGKVVIQVTVNRDGNVIESNVARGTTNTAPCLVETAKASALKSKWSADENAPEKQTGFLTYNFRADE